MTAWILSIVGIVFVGVLFDLICPEGKMSTFIKSVFAIMTLFVIIRPIPKWLKQSIHINWDIDLNEEYLGSINAGKVLYWQDQIKKNIESMGYSPCDVVVDADLQNSTGKINNIYVDFSNYVLNGGDKHIIKYEKIQEMIMEITNIKKEKIVFYG